MSLDFLNEAFNRLRKLDEEAFDMSDLGIHELGDFQLKDEDTDFTPVIDPDAHNEHELDKTYIDQVILECPICHSNLFKKIDSVVLNPGSDSLANSNEVCPFCGEGGGFVIVGQVKKFNPNEECHSEEVSAQEDSIISTDSETEDSTEAQISEEPSEKIVEESLSKNTQQEIIDKLKAYGYDLDSAAGKAYIDAAIDYLGIAMKYDPEYTIDTWVEDTITNYPDDLVEFKIIEEGIHFSKIAKIDEDLENVHLDIEDGELEVETGDKKICIKDGKTVIEDKVEDCDSECDEEVIAPVDDATAELIVDNNEDEKSNTETSENQTEINIDSDKTSDSVEEDDLISIEDESEIESEEKETEEKDDDMQDIEIDEIQEESFNTIGNKLLQNIYENVDHFNLTKASTNANQLKLEGLITFKSGKTKATQFTFEAKDISRTGRLRFLGENMHISSAKKPFMITGYLKDKTYVVESLNYNFSAKKADGTPIKIQGTVSTKR